MGKILALAVGFCIILTGCAYKSQAIYFDPYAPKVYKNSSGHVLQKVYLKSVVDLRQSTEILGTVIGPDKTPKTYAASGEMVSVWLYEAIKSGLQARSIFLIDEPQKDAKTVKIYIKQLHAVYDENLFKGNNLRARMDLKVEITKGKEKIVKSISQESSMWHKPIRDAQAFKPILQELMEDIADRTIKEISDF